MTKDIDLSSVCGEGIGDWIPIGDYGTDNNLYFAGTFNGQGHNISNLYINNDKTYQGLFGKNSGGTINNVNIISPNIKASAYIGAITGENIGKIYGCSCQSGSIENTGVANAYLGGIAGYNNDQGTIEKSYNTSDIFAALRFLGGIAGESAGIINNCYNSGNISSDRGIMHIGGIVGNLANGTGSVENCYNTGSISGHAYLGGIAGNSNEGKYIKNCYNVGNINKKTGGIVGQEMSVENSYYLEETATGGIGVTDVAGSAEVRSEEYMKTSYFVTDLNAGESNWKIVAGMNEGYPILDWQTETTGITAEFTTISTAQALKDFATTVNKGNTFAGKPEVKLTKNIDLSSVCSATKGDWTPIGDYGTNNTLIFAGTFNGQGKTISNLYINNNKTYQSLFGKNTGTINNVNVISPSIKASVHVGGIAGENTGTINGCSSQSGKIENTITEYATMGGITGNNTGTIENCFNTSEIKGGVRGIGGIVGSSSGTIKKTYNSGKVNAVDANENPSGAHIGGIAGFLTGSGRIENCYNIGNVIAKSTVGGIVGNASDSTSEKITNCYNTGAIGAPGAADVGGIAGSNLGTITNSYYLDTTAPKGIGKGNAGTGGTIESKTAAYMKSSSFVTDLGSSNWKAVSNGYPVLK